MIMMVTRIEIMISSTVATKKIAIMIGFVIQLLLQKARKRTLHLEIRKVVILRIKMLSSSSGQLAFSIVQGDSSLVSIVLAYLSSLYIKHS